MLVEKLWQKFPDMQDLRVRDIRVDKTQKKVFCVLSYPDMVNVKPPERAAIRGAVAESVPKGYRYDVQLVSDVFNERSLTATLADLIKRRYPLFAHVCGKIAVSKVAERHFAVTFSVNETTKKNMEVADFLSQLQQFFESYTCYEVEFAVAVDKTLQMQKTDLAEQERLVHLAVNKELLKPQRFFNVTDVQKHIGKEINTKPMYISDVRKPMDSCVLCGKISEKTLRAAKNNTVMQICKFNLTDGSLATMPCIMFVRFNIEDFETIKQTTNKPDSEVATISKKQRLANEKKMKMLMFLTNGLEILVRGKVVYSDFSQRLEMHVYDICTCRIQPVAMQPVLERETPQFYTLVFPQPVEEYRQLSFTNWQEKPSLLTGKNCVVMYANVTGYNVTKDKIYSLCCFRLVDGHIREKFATLVMPETDLSDQQLKDANVTVKQLMLSPTLTEVVPDLFKFTHGATLVGMDLPALVQLLNYYGAPIGYNFKNDIVSQTEMLASLFENSTYDVRPSYLQLKDVAKALKLNCNVSSDCREKASAMAKIMSLLAQHAK